jgi:hypothetical protein
MLTLNYLIKTDPVPSIEIESGPTLERVGDNGILADEPLWQLLRLVDTEAINIIN